MELFGLLCHIFKQRVLQIEVAGTSLDIANDLKILSYRSQQCCVSAIFLGYLSEDMGINVQLLRINLLLMQYIVVLQQKLFVLLLFLLVISQFLILGLELVFLFLHLIELLLFTFLVILLFLPDFKELLVHFIFQVLSNLCHLLSLLSEVLGWRQELDEVFVGIGEI